VETTTSGRFRRSTRSARTRLRAALTTLRVVGKYAHTTSSPRSRDFASAVGNGTQVRCRGRHHDSSASNCARCPPLEPTSNSREGFSIWSPQGLTKITRRDDTLTLLTRTVGRRPAVGSVVLRPEHRQV